MSLTRRQALTSASAAVLATSIAKPAVAQKSPIQIGYLPAFTGPSSSTGIGINRGTQLAVEEINTAGGINGRKIELVMRDTQSDPTKAVNAAAELTRRHKVSVVWGPVNSGETLAVMPLLARANVPHMHPCWVDTLTDPKKYPMASATGRPTSRSAARPTTTSSKSQGEEGRVDQRHHRLWHRVARCLHADAQEDRRRRRLLGERRCQQSGPQARAPAHAGGGAEAIMPWSVNAGFLARIINTRAELNWDVPIVGQTTLGSGQTKALLAKPEYWEKVYPNNFRPCATTPTASCPPHRGVRRASEEAKVDMGDTLLWWVALGYDGPRLIAEAIKAKRHRAGQDHGLLEPAEELPGRLRHHHLHAGQPRRLSGQADHDGPSELAQGRRVQSGSGLRRLSRWFSRSSGRAGGGRDLRADRHHLQRDVLGLEGVQLHGGHPRHGRRHPRLAVHPAHGHAGVARLSAGACWWRVAGRRHRIRGGTAGAEKPRPAPLRALHARACADGAAVRRHQVEHGAAAVPAHLRSAAHAVFDQKFWLPMLACMLDIVGLELLFRHTLSATPSWRSPRTTMRRARSACPSATCAWRASRLPA